MKAEQRKELETNTLADKMGRVMTRVKGSPRRSFLIYLTVISVSLVLLYLGYRWWIVGRVENSERWYRVYDGAGAYVNGLAETEPLTYPGKAARFQQAWAAYWELGVKMIGNDAKGAMKRFEFASGQYKKLAEDCKDDPLFEPQALLGLAVVEETMAIQDPERLDKATAYYKTLAEHEKYKDYAQGKFAKERYSHLKDEKKRAEMSAIYKELQKIVDPHNILAPAAPPAVPPMFDHFFKDKDKEKQEKK